MPNAITSLYNLLLRVITERILFFMAQTILENYHQSPVTYFIILAVLIVSFIALGNKKLHYKLILHPQSVVRDRQYYRIFTADLVNADWIHLLLNELMLYVFCTHLEYILRARSIHGSTQFLAIYLSSLVLASLVTTARYYKKFEYATTGSSGSLMGCMFSFMMLDPDYWVFDLPGLGPIRNIYAGLAYIIILIIYQKRRNNGLINNEYHFYGAVGGIVATLILYPEVI